MWTPLVLTQQIDSTTWQALGLLLTLVGLLVSAAVWRRSGAGPGLRAAGWSLVPLAAGLTGLLRLIWEILDSLLRWAVGLVFSPVVWTGLGVAAVAVVLHVAGSLLVRRQEGGRPGPSEVGGGGGGGGGLHVEDQDDIEAILRKHGIE